MCNQLHRPRAYPRLLADYVFETLPEVLMATLPDKASAALRDFRGPRQRARLSSADCEPTEPCV